VLKDILHTLLTRVAVIPLGMLTGIIAARYLGPSERGVMALFLLFPYTVKTFCTFGLDTASIYLHRKEKVPFEALFANCLVFGLIGGTAVASAVWLIRGWLPGQAFQDGGPLFLVALATVPPVLLYQYLGGLARAVGEFRKSNMRSVIDKVLDVASMVLLFFIFHAGVYAYLIGHFVIISVVVLWMCWDLRPYLRGRVRPDVGLLGRMMRFGLKTYAQGIASHAHYRADVYLVAMFLGKAEIAFYAIGAGLAERSLMLSDAMGTVLFPKLAGTDARQAAVLTARASRYTLLLGGAMALAICLSGRFLVQGLYGREYLPAVAPMYFLVSGVLMVGLTRILMRYLTSQNVHQHNAYLVGGSAVVNIALNLWLIPALGIVGAAVSSLCTYALQGAWALYLFGRFSGLPVRTAVIPVRADFAYLRGLTSRARPGHAPSIAR
jgi:O-antigen/teichoic acid export membrane protein